jgi:eukaryotic-like serine/threonine-protein kinase
MQGQLLDGRYEIEQILGAGGFGQTFIAKDRKMFDAICVVKLLKPAANDAQTLELARRMFAAEARLLHDLGNHDRIPRLFASFEAEQNFYLVQEYVEGHPLSEELIPNVQLSEADVIQLVDDILEPLAFVHQHKIIHRDIKPPNLMRRNSDGKIVLIDFGSVKQIESQVVEPDGQTKMTVAIGTYGYMPTEQGAGTPELSSDLYAVGMIAIQALTGVMPYKLSLNSEREVDWQTNVSTTPEFAAFINKMIRYDCRQRYQSAPEALEVLKHFASPNGASINQPFSNSVATEVRDRSTSDNNLDASTSFDNRSTSDNYSYIPTNYSETASSKHQTDLPIASSESNQQFDRIDLIENPHPSSNSAQSAREQKLSTNVSASRRNLIKWLGFGGVGVVSAGVLHSVFGNSSSSKSPEPIASKSPTPTISAPSPAPSPVSNPSLPTADVLSQPKTPPKLTKIQFTSVKLDKKGEIIDKPAGSAEIFTEGLGDGVGLTMVKIPAGKFMMGSPESEVGRSYKETIQPEVKVPEFYCGQTLVTQAQWMAIMGNNPAHFKGNDKLPIEQVSWLDAMDFCKKLSQKTGRTYRLPNEAEWEYACRAGTTTPFAFGETITPAVANYNGNANYGEAAKGDKREKTTPVGSFPPNLFGLYDLHGNLWQWCLDESGQEERVMRGGSWYNDAFECRSAYGYRNPMSIRTNSIGFRVVSLPSKTS